MRDHFLSAGGLLPLNCVIVLTVAQLCSQCLVLFVCLLSVITVLLRLQRLIPRSSDSLESLEAMTSSASSNAMKVRKPEPAEIEYKNMKFLITYRPTDATMDRFIEVWLSLSRLADTVLVSLDHQTNIVIGSKSLRWKYSTGQRRSSPVRQ